MERINKTRMSAGEILVIALMYLMAFQDPLEQVAGVFGYIDELVALGSVGLLCLTFVATGEICVKKYLIPGITALGAFLAVGLLGNLIFGYQGLTAVAIDLFTHLKYFFALVGGYLLLPRLMDRTRVKSLAFHLRLITLVLLILFAVERFWPVFGETEIRYGLRSARMIFSHPTYLAAATAFLAVAMTVFFEKKNLPYMLGCLVMMAFTLRAKAIASAAAFAVIFVFVLVMKKELKLWHGVALGALVLALGWGMFQYHFIELGGSSARSVLLTTSFRIAQDHFPIGTGFGAYASSAAATHYSPVYVLYGLDKVSGLTREPLGAYLNDSFWPIIIGQTGILGTAAYLFLHGQVALRTLRLQTINRRWFVAGLCALVYLLISSTSEPAFNNAMAVPLAMVLGGTLQMVERRQFGADCPRICFRIRSMKRKGERRKA